MRWDEDGEMYSEEQNAVDLLDDIFSIVMQSNEKVFSIKNNDETMTYFGMKSRSVISEIDIHLKTFVRKN